MYTSVSMSVNPSTRQTKALASPDPINPFAALPAASTYDSQLTQKSSASAFMILDKRLLPLVLQFSSDQAILRLHTLILSRCARNIVAHSFQILLPVTMKPRTLLLDVFRRFEA